MRCRAFSTFALFLTLAACGPSEEIYQQHAEAMDSIAEHYVKLALAMGEHDAAYVDAYFGPAEWREQAKKMELGLPEIVEEAGALLEELKGLHAYQRDDAETMRRFGMEKRLRALMARAYLLQGAHMSFDEQTRLIYDAVAPTHDNEYFKAILAEIDALIPGDDKLPERVNAFRDQFVIPTDRLEEVFSTAIEECRRRTLEHIWLPDDEHFTIEYVTDKPWSGYNWYQGGAVSLIQINLDLPIQIERAVDLGCHEGYPGHHTFHTLQEESLVKDRGWMEFSVYPLFSPVSLISEGSANYGKELAFPGEERMQFEREVLFPMAGLDVAQADTYYRLLALLGELNYARNEAARGYLNKRMSKQRAAGWLIRYGLRSPKRADKDIAFIQAYGAYVINYNLGKDMVKAWVEKQGSDQEQRWEAFDKLLRAPMVPSDLQ
jgi:hypothetical protein